MGSADALLTACLTDPDADLPRFALADALDDRGDDRYAEFIRVQIELARLPVWEPLAVHVRHRRPDLHTGEPFRDRLPDTGNAHVAWAAEPFHRGLGWAVKVWQLADLLSVGDQLFELAPVGELLLPDAPRDHWAAVAARPWLDLLRVVRFTSLTFPIEPVRLLSERPGGVRTVWFQRTDSPAVADLLGGLARSLLGQQLTALHLRSGYPAAMTELIEELEVEPLRLVDLGLVQMGLTPQTAERLAKGPLLDPVRSLNLTDCQALGDKGFQRLFPARAGRALEELTASRCGLGEGAVRWLSWSGTFADLRRLDLSLNPRLGEALEPLAREGALAGLRSLALRQCVLGDPAVKHLTRAAFWPNLVELDLRGNQLGDVAARHLLQVAVPAELTALLLGLNAGISEPFRQKLRAKYGEAVRFDEAEQPA